MRKAVPAGGASPQAPDEPLWGGDRRRKEFQRTECCFTFRGHRPPRLSKRLCAREPPAPRRTPESRARRRRGSWRGERRARAGGRGKRPSPGSLCPLTSVGPGGPEGRPRWPQGAGRRVSERVAQPRACACARRPTPAPAPEDAAPAELPGTGRAFIAGRLEKVEEKQEEAGCPPALYPEVSSKHGRRPCPSSFPLVRHGFLVSAAAFTQVRVRRRSRLSPALQQTVGVQVLAPPTHDVTLGQ